MLIVGRDTELDVLTRAVDNVLAGHGRLTLLRGEAGIGKSRLAEHVIDLARDRGITVLRGQAHPLHAGLAYAPIVEAIRPHVANLTDHAGLAHLGRLLADPRLPSVAPSGTPELQRTLMFEAVVQLIDRLSPAVLFIDDLHWADRGTIELVNYIGLGVRNRRLLVVAAYRPSEAGTPLDDLAVSVRRDGPDRELSLAPLTDSAVAQLTGTLLGAEPTADLLEGVTKRAKGVPLFVTALVHDGFHAGATLPTIVRDVVLARLHQLDEPERHMIEVVAVAGDAASSEVIRAVVDDPAALRNLVVGGLVTERQSGREVVYRVAHPLYAEVAYAELTVGERRKLHAALLTAIEKTSPDDVLALAPHYQEAGDLADPIRAVEIMAEAGWRALAMRAADEAIRYLGTAVELAGTDRVPALLDGLGRAHQSLGRYEQALGVWKRGLGLAARHGMMDDAGGLQLRIARLESESSDSKAANERLHALAQRMSVSSHEAAFRHFEFTMRHSDEAEAREVTSVMAGFAGPDQPAESQAVGYLGRAFRSLLDKRHHEAVRELETAVAHARQYERQFPFYARFTRLILGFARALTGDVTGSFAGITEGVATQSLIEIPSLKCYEQYGLAFATYLNGDITKAVAEAEIGVATAVAAHLPRSVGRNLGLRAFLLAEQGRLSEAQASLAKAKQSYLAPEMSLAAVHACADAAVGYHLGEPASTKPFDYFSVFADPLSGTMRPLFTCLAALAAGDNELVARMSPVLHDESPRRGLLDAFADRLDGLRTGDPDAVAAAADRLTQIGAPLLAAQTRLEWAELVGDRDVVPAVLEVFERAGAAPWADRTRQHARGLGLRLQAPRGNGPLTNRETQVVRLLGEGLSNADIAGRLFVSERTVETHLRNSYAKLNLTSRVALARWADEHLSPE